MGASQKTVRVIEWVEIDGSVSMSLEQRFDGFSIDVDQVNNEVVGIRPLQCGFHRAQFIAVKFNAVGSVSML